MPLAPPTPCAGCKTTEAGAYLETNAGVLGHAPHGLLCAACWHVWMRGRRWKKSAAQGHTEDLERSWEEMDEVGHAEPAAVKPQLVDLFGKPVSKKKRRKR